MMIDPIIASLKIAASALNAQSMRHRVISENLANAESAGKSAGADPYRRKVVSFANELDEASGVPLVRVDRVLNDNSDFRLEYQPGHPAADASGYVKLPNVNLIAEMADLRQAGRSYEANLQVLRQGRDMMSMTIDLLRAQS